MVPKEGRLLLCHSNRSRLLFTWCRGLPFVIEKFCQKMSSQRGNVSRTRKQKHVNAIVYKNNKHGDTPKTKVLNTLQVFKSLVDMPSHGTDLCFFFCFSSVMSVHIVRTY